MTTKPTDRGSGFGAFLREVARAPDVALRTDLLPASLGAAAIVAHRYRVERHLGAGGMGDVYLATDTRLDRQVALKVARSLTGAVDRAAVLREGKALASLSHPNVLQVFEVGTHDDHLFIAMAYVAGGNAAQWAAAQPRPWREVLAIGRDAAGGLAAAHRQGIVHRDVKPANILIDHGGRAQIADFGLADLAAMPTTGGDDDGETSTGAGRRIVGTVGYLAPELWLGGQASAATDRFALCVSIWELLVGRRPHLGVTAPQLQRAAIEGAIDEAADSSAPRWLLDALERGLDPDPRARPADMAALLASIDPERRRTRSRRAALVTGLAALVAWAAFLPSGGDVCARSVEPALWGPARARALEAAFVASGAPSAESTATRVIAHLEAWAHDWGQVHDQVCAAAPGPDAASAAVAGFDGAMACLDRVEARTAGIVELFVQADRDVVATADAVLVEVPAPEDCLRRIEETSSGPPSPPPSIARDVARLRGAIAYAEGLIAAGRLHEGGRAASAALDASLTLGYEPLVAESLLVAGIAHKAVEDRVAATARLQDAHARAHAVRDDRTAARAAVALLPLVAVGDGGLARAEFWRHQAELAEGRGGAPQQTSWQLEAAWAEALHVAQRRTDAIAAYARALELQDDGDADPMARAELLGQRAWMDVHSRPAQACAMLEEALEAAELHARGDHPLVATLIVDWTVCTRIRDGVAVGVDARREALDRALAMERRLFGPGSLAVSRTLLRIASDAVAASDLEAATAAARESLAIAQAQPIPARRHEAAALLQLGRALGEAGELDQGVVFLRESLAAMEVLGRPVDAAVVRSDLAELLSQLGRHDEAERELTAAIVTLEDEWGDTIQIADILVHRGRVRIALGFDDGGLADLDRAAALVDRGVGDEKRLRGSILLYQADLHRARARHAESVVALRAAAESFAEAGDRPMLVYASAELARDALEAGEVAQAADAAARGLAVSSELGGDPDGNRPRLLFTLGVARWRQGAHDDGVRLVTEAEQTLLGDPLYAEFNDYETIRAEIRAWLRDPA